MTSVAHIRRTVQYGALLASIIGITAVAGEAVALSSHGSSTLLVISFAAVFPIMLVMVLAAVAVLLLLAAQTRRVGLTLLAFCAAYFVVAGIGLRAVAYVRQRAFRHMTHRARPLVNAIRQYESKHKVPPRSLNDLIPEHLSMVPSTGIGAYPSYEYATGSESRAASTDNTWILVVHTPIGLLNWDMLVYYPNQKYPATAYGGVLERIEDWAYVHE